MKNLVVVDNPQRWPIKMSTVHVVAARNYLTDDIYARDPGIRVFNLCRSFRYQSFGYYVSLLAHARGHKPIPNIITIQDMRTRAIARVLAADLEDEIQRLLKPIKSDEFTLSVYFGKNLARRYETLAAGLFRIFPAPLFRAEFTQSGGEWRFDAVKPVGAADIPANHHDFVVEAANEFFAGKRIPTARKRRAPYALAILVGKDDTIPPSNKRALDMFSAAGRSEGFDVELIEKSDFNRLAEFDALFIRETTNVAHHTYRFSRRAAAEGLIVIDDPDSIARCANKVYLAELLKRSRVATPKTCIVHKDNRDDVLWQLGLPCVIKLPDSSYSQGVIKAETEEEFAEAVHKMLEESDLLIAQEFVPTDFDWRVGLLDGKPLYACKYYMVAKHWQIYKSDEKRIKDGEAEAVPLEDVPEKVLSAATRATKRIGAGFYGVDLKEIGGKVVVIEVNDNPSIDAGVEDGVLGKKLYETVMHLFRRRIEEKAHARGLTAE